MYERKFPNFRYGISGRREYALHNTYPLIRTQIIFNAIKITQILTRRKLILRSIIGVREIIWKASKSIEQVQLSISFCFADKFCRSSLENPHLGKSTFYFDR